MNGLLVLVIVAMLVVGIFSLTLVLMAWADPVRASLRMGKGTDVKEVGSFLLVIGIGIALVAGAVALISFLD